MPNRVTMWQCSFGCYQLYASKHSCAMHETMCWLNPARKPVGLLPRGILPGDQVRFGGERHDCAWKTGELLAYTPQGAYVWTYSGTAFVDADKAAR